MTQTITDNSINTRIFPRIGVTRENLLPRCLATALAVVVVAFGAPLTVQATTIGCTGTTGDSAGLIMAITNANDSAAGGDTINLGANCIYAFTTADNWWYGPNALPPVASNIIINGNGATLLALHTGDPTPITANAFRFFYVAGGLELRSGSLTLNDLTLSGGYAKGGDSPGGGGGAGMGGAIFNQGRLVLAAVTLNQNRTQGGSSTPRPATGSNIAAYGGGGLGQDASIDGNSGNGGGFGGFFSGVGGLGAMPQDRSGGGGGFITGSDGNGWTGGGQGSLGNAPADGGSGGAGGLPSGVGGNFGWGGDRGGAPINNSSAGGGGGGIGGGGGGAGGVFGDAGGGGFGGGGGGSAQGYIFGIGGVGGFGGGGGADTVGAHYAEGGFGAAPGIATTGGGGGGFGGAIFNHAGIVNLTNSTFAYNGANGGIGGSGLGGAIFNLNGTVTLNFCTVASNTVSGSNGTDASKGAGDGAIYSLAFGNKIQDGTASIAIVTIRNSIVYGNVGANNGVVNNVVAGTLASNAGNAAQLIFGGGNIIYNAASFGNATSSGPTPLVANPNLGPLQNNGGTTLTMALPAGSPAIDAGVACVGNVPATDQIGNARIWGRAPDLGAYEYASQPGSNDDIFGGNFDTANNCP